MAQAPRSPVVSPAASVVLTAAQVSAIVTHFCQTQLVQPNATAIAGTDQITTAVNTLAMSISIGNLAISYSPAFPPPVSNMTTAQQSALICYMIQTAMGVPLMG
jgi:hypothetical protein